jgi:hypothetical protein
VEIHKTILDHIVTLNDQLLTRKMREAKHAFEQRYRQLRRQYRRGLAMLIIPVSDAISQPSSPCPSRVNAAVTTCSQGSTSSGSWMWAR